MRRLFALFICGFMVLSGCSANQTETTESETKMTPGTYSSVGTGFKGDIKVDVTVTEDEITDISVVEHRESNGIGAEALNVLVDSMLKYQTAGVDSVTGATVSWTAGSQNVTKVELLKAGSPVAEAMVASGTSQAVTYTEEISANASFSARVTDATKTTAGGSVSFNFVYPFYSGVLGAEATVDSAAIVGLTKSVSAKGNKSISYTTENTQKCVFAYPNSYGDLKSILDPNNFECIDTFAKSEVQVTGLDGTPQTYNVYAVNANIQAFTYQFKF